MSSLSTVQAIAQAIAVAVHGEDGEAFAAALQIDLGNTALISQLTAGKLNLASLCSAALQRPYDELLVEHLSSLVAAHKGDYVLAYAHQERASSCFQAVFEKDTAWSLPALHVLDLALRRSAIRADTELTRQGKKPDKLTEAAGVLQKSFRTTVTDRAPIESSKKWGALHVINNLFKIYFHLNNLRLCQNLIRAVEGPGFPKALDGQTISGRHFPMAQLVTYHYFVGRLSLLNSHFAQAERQLTFSFERCPAAAYKNKRLILRYLVPVRIIAAHIVLAAASALRSLLTAAAVARVHHPGSARLSLPCPAVPCRAVPCPALPHGRPLKQVRLVLGVFPSPAMLTKYKLSQFVQICRAVDRGDLRLFERELDEHQARPASGCLHPSATLPPPSHRPSHRPSHLT